MKKSKFQSLKGDYKVLAIIMVSLVMAFIVSSFVINLNRVVGISMEPTFKENDWVLINRLAYINASPSYNDIIVFRKKDVTNDIIIKRVIAVEGDTVEIKKGFIYVNDKVINDCFEGISSDEDMGKVIVERESYFVLGDNRNHSHDSRFWKEPFVNRKDIIGKVIF